MNTNKGNNYIFGDMDAEMLDEAYSFMYPNEEYAEECWDGYDL